MNAAHRFGTTVGGMVWLALVAACPGPDGADAGAAGDAGVPDAGAADAGDNAPDAGGTDAGPLPADAYCETIAPFFCDFYLRCGRMAVPDVDTCLVAFAEGCENGFEGRYLGLAAAGYLSLSPAGVEVCADHLADVACETQVLELAGPCGQMWQGTVPAGGACGFDVESFVCAPGTQCVLSLDLCGECRTTVDVGAACGDGVVTCVDGTSCEDGVCTARVPIGQACTPDDRCVLGASCDGGVCTGPSFVALGDACDADHRCPYQTACVGGVCVAAGSLGDACGAAAPCAAGYCDGAVCVETKADGAPCAANAECRSAQCVDDACAALSGRCF